MTGQPIPTIGVHQRCGRRWIDHDSAATCPGQGWLNPDSDDFWLQVAITILFSIPIVAPLIATIVVLLAMMLG